MEQGIGVIAMEEPVPAGLLGPDPAVLDVRAYLVAHETGLILLDTGMNPGGAALDAAMRAAGAGWSDVSHVVITHAHPDHVGGLPHVRREASAAIVLASPLEGLARTSPLAGGDRVGPLRVLATPGHTPGHLCFVDADRGVLFAGDCLGVVSGRLVRAPRRFTADPALAEQSLRELRALRDHRMLCAHGPEIADPWDQLDALLAGDPGS